MKKILFGVLAVALIVGFVSCNNEDPPHEYNVVRQDFHAATSLRITPEQLNALLVNGNNRGRIDTIKLIPVGNWHYATNGGLHPPRNYIIIPFMDNPRVVGVGTIRVPQGVINHAQNSFPNIVEEFNQFGFVLYGIRD